MLGQPPKSGPRPYPAGGQPPWDYAPIPPTRRPTAAVTAIANPPPTQTLTAARRIGAPPARAPAIPSVTRAMRALTTTASVRAGFGTTRKATTGKIAPAVKLSAE